MAQLARQLVSEAEFRALPETTQRLELFDGELIVSPRPSYQHQEMLSRIVVALRRWAAAQQGPVTNSGRSSPRAASSAGQAQA